MELGAPGRPVPSFWNLCDDMGEYLMEYQNAVTPVPSTIPELDERLKGGFRPGVHFIGGNTGAGKSALCLWMAQRMASLDDPVTGEKTGVTYISLELSKAEVRARMGSRLSAHLDHLQTFSWTDFEELGTSSRAALEAETYYPEQDPVYCADLELMAHCPNVRVIDAISRSSHQQLLSICLEIEACGAHKGRVCFIDYLQCIEVESGMEETEAMKEAVRAINLAGIRAGVAVIVIAAVNRAKGTEMRKGKPGDNPGADIFRGSSWIEYTGLTAMALVRREDAMCTDNFTEVELHIVKNRRGIIGEPIQLAYDGAHGEFVFDNSR